MRNNKIINKGKINALIFCQILPTDYFSCSLYTEAPSHTSFRGGGGGSFTQVRSITIGDKVSTKKNELLKMH